MLAMNGRFKTKKALRERVALGLGPTIEGNPLAGKPLHIIFACRDTSLFGSEMPKDGTVAVVGPSEYDRRWYAQLTVKDGAIVAVK